VYLKIHLDSGCLSNNESKEIDTGSKQSNDGFSTLAHETYVSPLEQAAGFLNKYIPTNYSASHTTLLLTRICEQQFHRG